MKHDELIAKTLAKIKEENIKPYSKLHFILKYSIYWVLTLLFLIFNILSISLIIYLINDLDWDIYTHFNDSILESILIAIPHFWIIIFLITIYISYKTFRKTKKSYKYNFTIIISLFFLISTLFAVYLYNSGLAYQLNQIFKENIPQYQNLIHSKEDQWMQVNKGLLAGTIEKVNEDSLILKDFNNQTWTILLNSKTNIKRRVLLERNYQIKIIGQKINENTFMAYEIRPWQGRFR